MNKRDSLYSRYAYNGLIKNKALNLALAAILVLSAFLMATGSMVMERLVGSVNQLFEEAKPPHFLQMHKDDYDVQALARFASERPEIKAWLIEEMLGFDGAAIVWQRPSTGESADLSDSLIDNLFVVQNEQFDFLIDQSGGIPRPAQGEVYVPVAYQQAHDLVAGDVIRVRTTDGIHELRVQGFVRDAQMASSLSSATRFLVSDADFRELARAGGGAPEIIVEYLLTDPGLTAQFQRAYEADQELPKNGQAVTYQMIRIINAFSDGLVAIALVFVSLLLIVIALLNLRFVIRGTLEDEVREIGVLKAIGIPNNAIASLYLSRYSVLTLLACVLGGGLAIVATNLLTRSVRANYAAAPFGLATVLVPVLALLLVYLIVISICRAVLGGVRRVEVVNALVHGSTLDERQTVRRAKQLARRARGTSLVTFRGGNLGRRLALLDLRAESGQWVLIPIVFLLSAVLMALPMNLLSTFESPRFVTYMGAPESDLRADVQFSDDVDRVHAELISEMSRDGRLTDVRSYANVLDEARGPEGWETLRVEVGEYASGAVRFVHGDVPGPGQIALSVLNAEKYQVSTGDEMTIRSAGVERRAVVSGLYQDVTSGGFTAKMQGESVIGATGYVIYANTVDGVDSGAVAAEYNDQFPAATVIPMREYVQQTLSYVTDAFRNAALLSFVFGIGVALLITGLFLKLRLTRDRRKMGVLSAIGFSAAEIIAQIRFKTILVVLLGTLLGGLLAATVGEALVGFLISLAGLGIADLAFIPNPLMVYVVYPLALISAGYLGVVLLTTRLRGADKSSWLKG